MQPVRLETQHLRKAYPGTVALDDVTLSFEGGRVSALIGKNGAGKSTLVKILAGAVTPDSGSVRLNDRALVLRSPGDAIAHGIAAVHQELSLIPDMTVAENILLGRLPKRRFPFGFIVDWRRTFDRAAALVEELGISLDVRARVSSLSIARQQVVEIAKAMSHRPAVLMLDEPTSALARTEVDRLFELIRSLARRGVVLIYISHRLHEIPQIADTVTALRDGRHAGSIPIDQADPKTIVRMMFGDAAAGVAVAEKPHQGGPVLEVRGLSYRRTLTNVSFTLHAGEILGIAGMLGSGRTELLMSIFGGIRPDKGEIRVSGRRVTRPTPFRMKRLGIALAPENRKTQGIVSLMSIRDNACLAGLSRISWAGVMTRPIQRRVVEKNVRDLAIRTPGIDRPITALSGGNQQKVVIANWLNTQPRIMLFDEPTRGIDVEAKGQIFQIMRDLARNGIACIFVSSELEELPEVCHRVLVLRGGRISAEVPIEDLTREVLFERCMSG